MSDVDDLVQWLPAQYDEDERVAQAVTAPHDWHQGDGSDPWAGSDQDMIYMWPPEHHTPYEQDKHWRGEQMSTPDLAEHIARHDPARVLREVDAKRRIVNSFAAGVAADPPLRGTDRYAIIRMVLRLLALPYADRDGYREEWRP